MDYNSLCPGCFNDSSEQDPCPSCGYSPDSNPGAGLYLTPSTLLFNKYLVGRVLGQGGFGITYLGWDTNLGIRIAIKEFFPQGLVSRVPGESSVISYTGEIKDQFSFGVESFLRESKTLARFEHHPNIVTVRDFFKENNTAYMVMSFIEGLTLLEHLKNNGDRIPVDQAVQIIMPVLDALIEVHRAGIMHRDISPDNIFIDREGRIVLIDFGAARQEMREKSKSLSVILKAGYAPEEQYRTKGKQGPWTDIYAVAATIYRAISGETPPEAMDRLAEDGLVPPSQLGVEIEPGLEQVLLKALAVKAGDRFQTVEVLQRRLLGDQKSSVIKEKLSKQFCVYCGYKLDEQTLRCNQCWSVDSQEQKLTNMPKVSKEDHLSQRDSSKETNKITPAQPGNKPFWRYLIGFRSLTPWKMLVGGFYYLVYFIVILYSLFFNLNDGDTSIGEILLSVILSIIVLTLTFIISINISVNLSSAVVEKRKSWKLWTLSFVFCLIVIYSIFIPYDSFWAYYFFYIALRYFLLINGIIFVITSIISGVINKKPLGYMAIIVFIATIIVIIGFIQWPIPYPINGDS